MKLLTRLFRKKPRITKFTDEELRERLTSEQYQVTQYAGTEAPYSGEYLNTETCLLYTSPSPRDQRGSRMPSSA